MGLQVFFIAVKAIWSNKVRSFLTMLGVIIGVGSVVLLTSIGTGLQAFVTEQFAELGSNTIFVVPGNPFNEDGGFGNQEQAILESIQPRLKRAYLDEILRNNRDVITDGTATSVGVATAKYQQTSKKVTLYAVMANYEQTQSADVEKGQWFTDRDEKRGKQVVMLGNSIAEELFGEVDPVGKKIKLDSLTYRVEGVLESRGSGGFGGPSFDNYIYLPLKTLQDDFNIEIIDSFIVKSTEAQTVDEAIEAIERDLSDYLEEDEFSVFDQSQLLETITNVLGVLTAGLGGIAAISLVVGGIGIMNIMLVSVTERTREIGLRKALGATPNLIMWQFLIEAALLSVIGGLIGLLIAFLLTIPIQAVFPARITSFGVSLALGVSITVGLIFGAAPARRAANLSPIEALRYE